MFIWRSKTKLNLLMLQEWPEVFPNVVLPVDAQVWKDQLEDMYSAWYDRARQALQTGGARRSEVNGMIEEAEQYLWGPSRMSGAMDVVVQLKSARNWASKVTLEPHPQHISYQPVFVFG